MKEKVRQVKSWEELIKLIENVNPFRNTLVLTGWINRLDEDATTQIETLVFSVKPVEILKVELVREIKGGKDEDQLCESEGEETPATSSEQD